MQWRDPPNQSAEYRSRAEKARKQAEQTTDEDGRKRLLQDADAWERMAAYEDIHNPPKPVPGIS